MWCEYSTQAYSQSLIENTARLISVQFATCDVSLQRLKSWSTNLRKSRFPVLEQAYTHHSWGLIADVLFFL